MVELCHIHNCANTWAVRNVVVETFWIMYGFLV
jgi:hypothetical protein